MKKSKDILEQIVKALVEFPDEVSTETKIDEMGVLLTLHVNPSDMGSVIGRSGDTAKAIRLILRAIGMKESARINLQIAEPEGSTHSHDRTTR